MPFLIEIKARCHDLQKAEDALLKLGARFHGTDRQTDTYFQVPQGRLKLREGDIENALIYYHRPDQAEPKPSRVMLYKSADPAFREILLNALEKKVVVQKTRKIFFAANIKLHLDEVDGLGTYAEVEAIGESPEEQERLQAQCRALMEVMEIKEEDLVEKSYSDLLLDNLA